MCTEAPFPPAWWEASRKFVWRVTKGGHIVITLVEAQSWYQRRTELAHMTVKEESAVARASQCGIA